MPLDRWLPIFIVCIYLGLILESPILMALPISLLVILGLAAWWRKHSLDHLIYRRRFHYTRAFPGERFPVRIEIENRKLLPLTWLRTVDPWPKAVGPEGEDLLAPSFSPDLGFLTHVFSLRWYERSRRTYNLHFRKRGAYPLGPCKITSGDLFGIYEKTLELDEIDRLTVFPSLLPLEELHLPPEYPIGDQRSRRRISEDPNQVMGVRDYHPEDNLRKIHWPATAKTGELQVKVYQPTSAQVLMVCLNISTHLRYWEGIYPELLEHMISLAASLVDRGIHDGYRVGMISNGCLVNSDQPFTIQPGRSPQQLAHLLGALAGITPVVVAPFEQLILREVPRVPIGATLLIVTAVMSPELAETIVRIKKHERRITLLAVTEKPPPDLPGISCLHMPFRKAPVG